MQVSQQKPKFRAVVSRNDCSVRREICVRPHIPKGIFFPLSVAAVQLQLTLPPSLAPFSSSLHSPGWCCSLASCCGSPVTLPQLQLTSRVSSILFSQNAKEATINLLLEQRVDMFISLRKHENKEHLFVTIELIFS